MTVQLIKTLRPVLLPLYAQYQPVRGLGVTQSRFGSLP